MSYFKSIIQYYNRPFISIHLTHLNNILNIFQYLVFILYQLSTVMSQITKNRYIITNKYIVDFAILKILEIFQRYNIVEKRMQYLMDFSLIFF